MIDHIPADFGHWFAGLVDGEGSFGITMGHRSHRKNMPGCQFSLSLRNDDAEVLEYIQRTLGVGGVHYRERGETNRQGYLSKPRADLWIHKKGELPLLVELFRHYPLRSKKRLAFEVWARAVDLWTSGEWRGRWTSEKQVVAEEMQRLREEIKLARQYEPPDYPE